MQNQATMRLVAVQVERDTEKHRLDGEECHQRISPPRQLEETVRREPHVPPCYSASSTILPICPPDSISLCAPAASLSGKRAKITGFSPFESNNGHTFSRNAAAIRPLLAGGCARNVDPVSVRRLVRNGRRSTSALAPPWSAISAIRPSTAAAAASRPT